MSRRRSRRRTSPTPVYKGQFGPKQAERLLWRAGFGPLPGEVERLAGLGMKAAVKTVMRPRKAQMVGPEPVLPQPLAPQDRWGHDHLWWFDRMVRSNDPLRERMTLVWHDWFATSNDGVGNQALMLRQNNLFRNMALSSFRSMLLEVTRDPAMLVWLSGNQNTKWAPNENYARELMELFTLGAGARYSENDVRELARALTGWTNDWGPQGYERFRFKRSFHDNGRKKVFRQRGRFDWRDACQLCLTHPDHAGFFVKKLWSYFVPVPLAGKSLKSMKELYVRGGYKVRPVVQAILMHPAFYEGPRMVKPPIVHSAGLLRMRGAGITTESWVWISEMFGQRLFFPPNVSGWKDEAWLDTGTFRGRWVAARTATENVTLNPGDEPTRAATNRAETAAEAVAAALAFWGNPQVGDATLTILNSFAQDVQNRADRDWKQVQFRIMRQNALRTLIATSPDLQTC